jgi:transcription termination/antitermination protein NusG
MADKNKTNTPVDPTPEEVVEKVEEAKEVQEVVKEKEVEEVESKQEAEPTLDAESVSPEDVPTPPEVQEVQVKTPNLVIISETKNKKARWYVVHAYSGHEGKVAEMVKQRAETLNLTDKILEILIPTQEKIQIKRGQKKTVTEKIFPGYMLVHLELTDDAWLAVRTTQGVTGFVGIGSKPTALPKHEVDAIKQFMTQAAPQYKADFVEGEAVRITDGPFSDFLATVKSIDEEKGKVELLVNFFDRETPVSVDFLQVKKV